MRAREFTINVPITIKINGDGDPEIDMPGNKFDGDEPIQDKDAATNFVPPLQQELELMKHQSGKQADVIDQITADDDQEPSKEFDVARDFKRLAEEFSRQSH